MSTFITLCAQLLPTVAPTVAVIVWFKLPRGERWAVGIQAVVAVALTAGLILLAGLVHEDPRPFMLDPAHPALFPHAADNGFPSDHTAYAAAAALLVATMRLRLGLVLLLVSILGGLARVAANVHHVQDVVGGIAVALLAVALATLVSRAVLRRRPAGLPSGGAAVQP